MSMAITGAASVLVSRDAASRVIRCSCTSRRRITCFFVALTITVDSAFCLPDITWRVTTCRPRQRNGSSGLRESYRSRVALHVQRGSASEDPWKILGVEPSATREEVRAKFRQLIRTHHPDISGGPADMIHRFLRAAEAILKGSNGKPPLVRGGDP